jgi:hypothetical protein
MGNLEKGASSPPAIEKTAAANRGRVKSSEECAAISARLQNHVVTLETRNKQSAARTGFKDSEETCAKKSVASKVREAARRARKEKEHNG